jgi:NADPH-dependent F420 reductase
MRIAVLGGTGDFGGALCRRWGTDTDHEIRVGSRSLERARDAAATYSAAVDREMTGHENEEAAEGADLAVLAVPPDEAPVLASAVDSGPAVIVSPAVAMERSEAGFRYDPPPEAGSTAAAVAERVSTPVVAAFHALPAARLADPDAEFGIDVPIAGDDPAARERAVRAVESVDGLRPLEVGGLDCAPQIESLVPLLINVGAENGLHDLGVRFG